MKYLNVILFSFLLTGTLFAQSDRNIDNIRPAGKAGIGEFEAKKVTDLSFDGLRVQIGGANTLQFQGISHENSANSLPELVNNFNLATSNLDLNVVLAKGLVMHLRTYLSSQNHTEAWVKGGYIQIDGLDFIQEDFLSGLMENVRIKIGHMENNYGDLHFRRTDNGNAIYNPFVGNFLMDSFTTEVGAEIYYFADDFFGMLGLTNGKLNQSTVKPAIDEKINFLAKAGYDSQINQDLRIRLSASLFTSAESGSQYLYSGDRAGSRYYNVLDDGFRSGKFVPDFVVSRFAPNGPIGGEMTSIMVNPFVRFQGLEFFGVFETVTGKTAVESDKRSFNQIGAELLYRFGADEDLYIGGRYNAVSGELSSGDEINIDRINIGGGWFITNNVLAKVEYVKQTWNDYPTDSKYAGAEFSGVMLEAVIAF